MAHTEGSWRRRQEGLRPLRVCSIKVMHTKGSKQIRQMYRCISFRFVPFRSLSPHSTYIYFPTISSEDVSRTRQDFYGRKIETQELNKKVRKTDGERETTISPSNRSFTRRNNHAGKQAENKKNSKTVRKRERKVEWEKNAREREREREQIRKEKRK